MQNFSTLSQLRKCLVYRRPHCKCEKCVKLRCENKPDQSLRKHYATLRTNQVNYRSDFNSFLHDIVGIISFLIISSLLLWLLVGQHLWIFARMVPQSGRRVQLIILALALSFCLCITFYITKSRHQNHLNTAPTNNPSGFVQQENKWTTTNDPQTCNENFGKSDLNSASLKRNLNKKKNRSFYDSCAKKIETENNSAPFSSDEGVLKVYRRYNWYFVPSEMKFPPSFDNLVEILSELYSRVTQLLANIFSSEQ